MAEGIIIQESDVSVADVFRLIGESADRNKAKTDAFDASILKITADLKEMLSTVDTSTQKGLTQLFEVSEKVNLTTEEAIKLEKQKVQLDKLISQANVARIREEEAKAKALENVTKRTDRQNAAEEKSSSIYARVQKTLNTLNKEFRDIAVRKELGLKLSDQEIKSYEFLQQKIGRYDGVLKKVDASMGKFGRSVGDYKTAFNGLGFSVQQLLREAPSLANSFQTFALAISNNIPMFTDEVQKLVAANKELAAAGKPTTSVLKQIAQSVFSVTGVISLAVTAFTLLAPKIADVISGFFGMSEAEKAAVEEAKKAEVQRQRTIKRQDEFNQGLADETSGLLSSLYALRSTNKGSQERAELVKKLNDQYGTTLKNMSNELEFQKQINYAVQDYIAYKFNALKLQQNERYFNYHLKQKYDLEKKIKDQTELLLDQQLKKGQILNGTILLEDESLASIRNRLKLEGDDLTALEMKNDENEKQLKMLGLTREQLLLVGDQWRNMYKTDAAGDVKKVTTEIDMLNDSLSQNLELLDDQKKLIQQIRELIQDQRISELQLFSEEELKAQTEAALKNGKFTVDQLEILRGAEFNSREEFTRQRADSEVRALKDQLATEYQVQLEALINKRNELLAQEGATSNDRIAIQQDFLAKLKYLNTLYSSESSEQQRLLALQILKINTKLAGDLIQINKDKNETIASDNATLTETQLQGILDELESYYKQYETILYNSNATSEQIAKEEKENRIARLEEEIYELQKYGDQYKKEIEDRQLELAKLKHKDREDDKKALEKNLKEQRDLQRQFINAGIKAAQDASKKKEKLIDDDISANQKLADSLRQQAAQGNADAKESLAALDENIEAKQKLKQKEQQEQQFLEELKLLYDATQNYVDKGDSLPVAAAKAFSQVQGLKAIFQGIKGFVAGTKRTVGEELTPMFPGVDGHIVRVDGREKILNPDQSAATGGATTDEIVAGYQLARAMAIGAIFPVSRSQAAGGIRDQVVSEIRELKEVIKSKPDRTMSVDLENHVARAVLVTERGRTYVSRTRHKLSHR
jgi:hypothetical protein